MALLPPELRNTSLFTEPQDPFFPRTVYTSPAFLDTAACLCVLQETPEDNNKNAVWHCRGSNTDNRIFLTTDGRFFETSQGRKAIDGDIHDASNPPNTDKPLFWDENTGKLTKDPSVGDLSINDKACTARNHTTFTTALYRAVEQRAKHEPPVDAAPCYQLGGLPIVIQNTSSWQSDGCKEGFFCPNNTVNSLPQYCPPLAICQAARLAGTVCSFNGMNIGMGPFEPTVCQRGYYCPPGGLERLKCPAGSYCQPGASTPTPCYVGSSCPEGSTRQYFFIPFLVILLIDALLVAGSFIFRLRGKPRQAGSHSRLDRIKRKKNKTIGVIKGVTAQITGYRPLGEETDNGNNNNNDDDDHEMMPLNPTPKFFRGGTVFENMLRRRKDFRLSHIREEGGGEEEHEDPLPRELVAFVDSMKKATDTSNIGLSFGYKGLMFQPKGLGRPILQGITGHISTGSLTAVMGGSGAGKSTFVNVLMGKTRHTGGSVMVNNQPGKIDRYRKVIGYVPQDDIVLPELTVYENISHSARIRLPQSWSESDIEAHINAVIDCLDLGHVRSSIVGTVGKPVLSGGQRKRVSIGMELAAAPMAIILDEPTSGLDATTASSTMRTLKALGRLGITVIVIIHQPRYEIFDMLDDLILLGDGQTIYEGPQDDAQLFFEKFGYRFPEHSNQADVITDIITGNGRDYKKVGGVSKGDLIAHWKKMRLQLDGDGEINAKDEVVATTTSVALDFDAILRSRGAKKRKQMWLCFKRALLQQYRTQGAFWAEMILAAIAGFLLGLAEMSKQGILFTGFYRDSYAILSVATDFRSAPEMALLVAVAIGLVSGAPGVRVFSEELLLHKREAEAGYSRVSYFIAKVISVVPRIFFSCLHFTTPLFLLATPIIPWGVAFLGNLLYFYCIYGLASCISMVVPRQEAPLLSVMTSLILSILSGAAPPLSKVKAWKLEWLWRLSPGTWLAEVYFGNLVYPLWRLYDVDLAAQATGFNLTWVWRNMWVLFIIGTLYRSLAFVGLLFGTRLRR